MHGGPGKGGRAEPEASSPVGPAGQRGLVVHAAAKLYCGQDRSGPRASRRNEMWAAAGRRLHKASSTRPSAWGPRARFPVLLGLEPR